MTPNEFTALYLDLDSRIGVYNTLIKTMEADRQELLNKQAALSTNYLDSLTPLRDGQTIILEGKACVIESVMSADVVCECENFKDVDRLEISVWIAPSTLRQIDAQPGCQWSYPAEATVNTTVNPKEAA